MSNGYNITKEQLLYEYYSLDSLTYIIDSTIIHVNTLNNLEYLSSNPLNAKKIAILRYEVIAKFCHLAECLGAYILAYRKWTDSSSLYDVKHSHSILKYLSEYKTFEIDDFYKEIIEKNNIDYMKLFGYNCSFINTKISKKIDESIEKIKIELKEIAEIYCYHRHSYNAYKHGYRIWLSKDYQQNIDFIAFRDKYLENSDQVFGDIAEDVFKEKYLITTDDDSLSIVKNLSNYCKNLFLIIRNNHKAQLSYYRKVDMSPAISLINSEHNLIMDKR